MAVYSGHNAIELVSRSGASEPAIYVAGSFVSFVGDCAAGCQPASGNSIGRLGMRISRHRLFVVDSLAAH
jgi:hypothetical protein